MIDTQTQVKTYSKEEVDKLLQDKENEIRKAAINTLVEKNAELKDGMLMNGSDEFYNLGKWEVMRKMAEDMVKSGALPQSDNIHTIMIKMQAGREMGLKPIESIKAFYIVKGVLSIYGDAVIRRIREHGWILEPYVEEQNKCTATVRKGDLKYSETFTFEEAEKSGWTKGTSGLKAGWIDGINRKRKLRYGAISTLIKTYIPEVMGAAADIKEVAEDTVPLLSESGVLPEEADKPATVAQLENLRNLAKYDKMTAEDKDFFDESIKDLTFQQAVLKSKELLSATKKK